MFPEYFFLQTISYLGSMFGNGCQGCIFLSDMDISSKHMGASTELGSTNLYFPLVSLALILQCLVVLPKYELWKEWS